MKILIKINTQTKNRKRNIIWFNPPYSKNVSTKIGKIFLSLIDKHFPKHHGYSTIFNRNTVKFSYCFTKNMKNIIQSHNKKILYSNNTTANKNTERCNCKK